MNEESERSLEARERTALVGRHRAEEVHKLHRALARKSRQIVRLREHLAGHRHLNDALAKTSLLSYLAGFSEATVHLRKLHAAGAMASVPEAMSLVAGRTKALLECWNRFRAEYELSLGTVVRTAPPAPPVSPVAAEVAS